MTPEAWQRVKAIFDTALSLPPTKRANFLETACGADESLRAEVESLLAADKEDGFLETDALLVQSGAQSHRCSSCGTPVPPGAGFCPSCGAATPTEVIGEGRTRIREATTQEQEGGQQQLLQAAVGEDYEVLDLIGRGGFGAVFRAHDRKLKRQVAIKVLRAELFEAKTARARFRQEAQAAAKLRHPNIIPIFAVGDDSTVSYIVMPLIEGESLAAALAREGRLSPQEARRILIEAADALHCAHEAGIVHRDIKPENIMLEGRGRRVLIMDFGIARLAGAEFGSLTAPGMVIGTPWYMSPEQAVGSVHIDARSDIYSLGVVGYQLLTSALPFQGATPQEVITKHLVEVPENPTVHDQNVPVDLATVVMRCLSKKPEDRWSTAHELSQALSNEVRVPSRPAQPLETESRLERYRRRVATRRRAIVVAVAFVAVAVVIAVAIPFNAVPRGRYDLYMRTASAEGLTTDSKVLLQGLEVGRVVSVSPYVDRTRTLAFVAKLSIVERFPSGSSLRLPTGTRAQLEQASKFSPSVLIRLVPDSARRFMTPLVAGDTIDSYRASPAWADTSQPPRVAESRGADTSAPALRRTESPRATSGPSPPRAPVFGFLTINSDPFGTVFVDGVEVGDVPVVNLRLTPGRHIIEVRREGFQTAADTVEVVTGNLIRRSIRLIPK